MTKMPLNGPEDIPLRDYIRELPVMVLIYDNNEVLMRSEEINFSNPDHKRWLSKVSVWAFNNHCSVETIAKSDYQLTK
jgi:hypothetical protein